MALRRRAREEPDDEVHELGPQADPESVARSIVLNKLTAHARSRHELAEALAAKAVPDDVAARVLDRFEAVGLIDDGAFADAWVESRQRTRGLARRALAQELRRKGIDDELVRDAVDGLDEAHEREIARSLVESKVRGTRRFDYNTRVRRLGGLLARKGYPAGLSMAVVREVIAADEAQAGGGGEEFDHPGLLASDAVIEDLPIESVD